MPYNVYLKKNEEKRIKSGHPWVYANEVRCIEPVGDARNGDVATVYDFAGNYIGKGYINHFSKILVRIFIRDDEEPGPGLFYRRIYEANEYRKKLGFDNCCRAFFAESDGLPALIVDKYADVLSVQILSLGMELHREEIFDALEQVFSPRGIYERSDTEARRKEGLELRSGPVRGSFDPRVIIEENGLSMIADLENGQKTGYFLDQKENRLALRRYAKDADVLDCFCNVGGFSLNAAAGGARSVIAADISEKALSDVRENARLNGYADVITTECGDVFELLRNYRRDGRQFGLVVLDPPAFCKSASEAANAYKGYKDINIQGLKLVKSGGFLATASCSHYMTGQMFERMLHEAARDSGRTVRMAEVRTQAADHPALFASEETTYLKFYVLNVI